MKSAYAILALCAVTACGGDNGSLDYPYLDRTHNPLGQPSNPTRPFNNAVVSANAAVTSMISRNEDQVADYIKYRLNEWDLYNPDTGKNIARIDIANAARWMTDGDKSTSEIEQKFANDLTLMHMATYVIDNRLNSCFTDGTVGAAAQCFTRWRDLNRSTFDKIATNIRKNTTLLDITNANFNTPDNGQITLMVDEDGRINGVTLTQDGTETKFKNWTRFTTNDQVAIEYKLSYDSGGRELGLSYADFGTYTITQTQYTADTNKTTIIADAIPFAGGYASHEIAPADITDNVHFTGRAAGHATDTEHIVNLDGTATLAFGRDQGLATLDATFDNWYDIRVQNDDVGTIVFHNYTNKNNLVKMTDMPDAQGYISAQGAKMNVGYYAPKPDTGIPTEATGLVQYTENPSGVKMNIAFGVK